LEELRKELCMVQNMVKERSREMLEDAMQTRRLPPQSVTTISYAYGALASFVWWPECQNHVYHFPKFEQRPTGRSSRQLSAAWFPWWPWQLLEWSIWRLKFMCRGRKIVDHFPPLIFHKIKKL
jgi:hypothetical protein